MKWYTMDSVNINVSEANAAEIMLELQKKGWKNLQYVAHNSWGDCRAPEIMGDRPMTPKELKEREKLIAQEDRKELRELRKLAKKHGIVFMEDHLSSLEYMPECPKCGTKIKEESTVCIHCDQEVVWRSVRMPFRRDKEMI